MNDLLMYIDQIDQSVNDSEISVLEAMIDSYTKSIMIIQESDETTDLTSFNIFQEGEKWDKFKEDTKAPVLGNKDESIIKRLLMFIPRLIQKLITMVKKLITKFKAFKNELHKLKKIKIMEKNKGKKLIIKNSKCFEMDKNDNSFILVKRFEEMSDFLYHGEVVPPLAFVAYDNSFAVRDLWIPEIKRAIEYLNKHYEKFSSFYDDFLHDQKNETSFECYIDENTGMVMSHAIDSFGWLIDSFVDRHKAVIDKSDKYQKFIDELTEMTDEINSDVHKEDLIEFLKLFNQYEKELLKEIDASDKCILCMKQRFTYEYDKIMKVMTTKMTEDVVTVEL